MDSENYVYKKEVDWSLFNYGFAIPLDYQVVFKQVSGRFLQRGESKDITLYLEGKSYKAKLNNNNIDQKFGNRTDIVQIRYTGSSELAEALRTSFQRSYTYLKAIKDMKVHGDKSVVRLSEESKEYLAIYTTEYDDSYILEPIVSEDIAVLYDIVRNKPEKVLESEFNYEVFDDTAGLEMVNSIIRIRKLNKKIGDNLKMLYGYRCQICGKHIGEEYGSHIAEAHHIDYFVRSLNNDARNQMIVCPNHHSIIHDVNPVFDRGRLMYVYKNGIEEKLMVNIHL